MKTIALIASEMAASAVPFRFLDTGAGGDVPIFLSATDQPGRFASVNAGNSSGLYVGGGGLNAGFAAKIQNPSSYQALQTSLVQSAPAAGRAISTYAPPQPLSFALVQRPAPGPAFRNYEGTVFVDVFQPGTTPAGNPDNYAMIYVCPPDGTNYAGSADFLTAVEATAGNLINTVRYFNTQVVPGPVGTGLGAIRIIRVYLFSSSIYRQANTTVEQVAQAVCSGMLDALALGPTGLASIELPNSNNEYSLMPAPAAPAGGGAIPAEIFEAAAPAGTPRSFGGISTNDWDTVFGITFAAANQAIVAQGSSPASFEGDYTDPVSGNSYPGSGNFGAWQLTAGGSGANVNLLLPITGGGFNGSSYSGSATVQVRLNFLPQPAGAAGQNLLTQTTTANPVAEPVAVVQGVTINEAALQRYVPCVQAILDTWLNAHLQDFTHVFSSVDLGAVATAKSFQWLKPTFVSYAVTDPVPGAPHVVADSVLGVLAMTDGRTNPNLAHQISPATIPANCNAGFLIAPERFLTQMLMPGVYLMFAGASADDFDLSDDGDTIINTSPLNFPQLQLEDGTIIDDAVVSAGNFTLTVRSRTLQLSFQGISFTWKTGYTVSLDYQGLATLSAGADGLLTMATNDPTVSFSVAQTTGAQVETALQEAAWGVGAAVVGACFTAAASVAVSTIRAGVTRLVSAAVTTGSEVEIEMTQATLATADLGFAVTPQVFTPTATEGAVTGAENVAAQVTATLAGESYVAKLAGLFRANWVTILGLTISAGAGAVLSRMPDILEQLAEGNLEQVPTLDDFANEAISPSVWANTDGFMLESATLNGALQLGLNVNYSP